MPERHADTLAVREIRCFIGWSRRNVFPPHPNIHTDLDFARRHGFEGMIMSASQIVPHLHEALIDAIGVDAFFDGTQIQYKMMRPEPSEGVAFARVLRTEAPGTLELRVDDGGETLFIRGRARLGG